MLNLLENCLLLLGLPTALVLAGYWLVARLETLTAIERVAAATLAGLCTLVWNLSVVAAFRPVAGPWAWLCLWSIAAAVALPRVRRRWMRDVVELISSRRSAAGAIAAGLFLVFLLWPLLTTPGLVYHDGTSNHDGFLWIAGAEHLKRHTYWEMPTVDPTHPYAYTAGAIVGWRPPWGRIGGEALLALVSAIVGLAPVKIYVVATAVLYFPWVAAVYLAARTFLVDRLSPLAVFALWVLQPLFVFYHANTNLPNLLGALCGATVVIATARCLIAHRHRRTWAVLLAFAVHGLLCCYPEMWPFIALPAGLLWLRGFAVTERAERFRAAGVTLLGLVTGLALNFATTARAWYGFFGAIRDATLNDRGNLFARLSWPEYPAALLTLSTRASKSLTAPVAALIGIGLLCGAVIALRRARDRVGTFAMLSGAALLGAYTVTTGFNYGWQKTIQFAGPFIAAVLPVAALHQLGGPTLTGPLRRWCSRGALAAIVLFCGYATVRNGLEWHKWSHLKFITEDWFDLRDHLRRQEPGQPVLIDSATFAESFFQGMWAAYFLAETPIYYAARGVENGGYLREEVASEGKVTVPPGADILVSRSWADGFDANSPRRFSSDTVVLLKEANRVSRLEGVAPKNGLPAHAEGRIALTVRPHSRSQLVLVLALPPEAPAFSTRWHVRAAVAGRVAFTAESSPQPPWRFAVPLEAGRDNEIEFVADSAPPATEKEPPFVVRQVAIESVKR